MDWSESTRQTSKKIINSHDKNLGQLSEGSGSGERTAGGDKAGGGTGLGDSQEDEVRRGEEAKVIARLMALLACK